ncbi:MAG: PilZ domain-containing protein [Deltaproteobacteria bacterium]|nr:PilZ domain-containing protein [Deltaproteobacteria bacterium]
MTDKRHTDKRQTDKRQGKRAPVELKAQFGHQSPEHPGVIRDVSEGGLRLRARKVYPEGTTIFLHIEVPGVGVVDGAAIVKRTRMLKPALPPHHPAEMGLLLVKGDESLAGMVSKLLERFDERRDNARRELQIPVNLGDVRRLIQEYTQNIGGNGLYVVTDNPPPVGEELPMHIMLNNGNADIRVIGQVVHVVTADDAISHGALPGAGIRFSQFDGDGRERLLGFLRSLEG